MRDMPCGRGGLEGDSTKETLFFVYIYIIFLVLYM